MSEFWDTTHLFGWGWAHGKDLQTRWFFGDNLIIIIEKWGPFPNKITNAAVAVPLSITRSTLDTILTIKNVNVLSFAWLMWVTMPEHEEGKVAKIHLLTWPGSSNDNVRAVIASDGGDHSLSQSVIANMRRMWIRVLNRTSNDQDWGMGYHQALTHAVIILHDLICKDAKISPWTSPATIASMINMNPYFLEIWWELTTLLRQWKSLWEAYMSCMKNADMELFTTNSKKQLTTNAVNWTMPMDYTILERLNNAFLLKHDGYVSFLIEESREILKPSPDSLSPWVSAR